MYNCGKSVFFPYRDLRTRLGSRTTTTTPAGFVVAWGCRGGIIGIGGGGGGRRGLIVSLEGGIEIVFWRIRLGIGISLVIGGCCNLTTGAGGEDDDKGIKEMGGLGGEGLGAIS